MYNSSGIGTYIKNILPYIVYNSNYKFVFIGNSENDCNLNALEKCNYEFIESNAGIYSLKEQLFLNSKKYSSADLFFSPHYNIPAFIKSNLLVTVHDCAHLALSDIFINSFLKRVYVNFMFDRIKKKASHIITVSNFSKSEIIKFTGIDAEKITVIHNGVDVSWFNRPNKELCFFNKRPYIIYVGNIKPHKNLRRLLRAYEILKDQVEHDLVIVGQKDNFITGDSEVFKLSERMCGRVSFTGVVSDEQLREYVFNSSLMVFPSFYEGFGLPPLEAMAAGIPVCCSDIPVLKEVCGDCAEYFDPFDIESIVEKINLILNDRQRARSLSVAGIKRAKLFSWKKAANKYKLLVDSLV